MIDNTQFDYFTLTFCTRSFEHVFPIYEFNRVCPCLVLTSNNRFEPQRLFDRTKFFRATLSLDNIIVSL